MQQSVAAMSQLHAQQQQHSVMFAHNQAKQVFPNQPMYTSMVPSNEANAHTPSAQQAVPGPGTAESHPSQSMMDVINQMFMSNTQGGPEAAAALQSAKNA